MSDHGYRKSHGMGKDIQMKLGRPQEDYRETEKYATAIPWKLVS